MIKSIVFTKQSTDCKSALAGGYNIIGTERVHTVYMDASLAFSKQNKPELYSLREEGKISHVPGVDAPYDTPLKPALTLNPEENVNNIERIVEYLNTEKILPL